MDAIAAAGEGNASESSTTQPLLRVLLAWALAIAGADLLLWARLPGLAWGIYASLLLGLILLSRSSLPGRDYRIPLLVLFVLSALQTARFISMSNVLTLIVLLLVFAGDSYAAGVQARWARWVEQVLAYLRPVAAIRSLAGMSEARSWSRFGRWLQVVIPAAALVLIFSVLLGFGNPIFADAAETIVTKIQETLARVFGFEPPEVIFLLFMACATFPLIAPPVSPLLGDRLARPWADLGQRDRSLRIQQWRWSLIALNLLFLVTNIVDVVFLWFGMNVPEGVSHSDYVHEGVYALTATTVLSGGFMALLLQHPPEIREDRWVRWSCYAWLVQNLVLISGVFLRLWLYIDALGYTPKRVYVALFLVLVLCGYALLLSSLLKDRSFKWLLGANFVLLFVFFGIQQFLNVPGFVANQNLALYQDGKIEFPDMPFLLSIGSEALPMLISIHEKPRPDSWDEARAKGALEELAERQIPIWKMHEESLLSFQGRAASNYEAYRDWRERH